MNAHKGMSVQPKVPDKLASAEEIEEVIYQSGNPDLEVGDTHKVRIQRDIDRGPYGIYPSEVKGVYKAIYIEEVSFPKTSDRPATKRIIPFPKADHRFGIDSCDLSGNSEN